MLQFCIKQQRFIGTRTTNSSFFKHIRRKKLPGDSVGSLDDQDTKGFIEQKLSDSFRMVSAISWEIPMVRDH